MLSLDKLSSIRGEKNLFEGLSLTLAGGALLVLRGANGSGKTSLLKILAGLLPPSHGKILWNDNDVSRHKDEYMELLEYIGHKNGIKRQLTASDNLKFWSCLHHTEMLIPTAVSYFGLEEVCDLPCHMLSAGWQRRVALSRLMLSSAGLWLLDEPFTGLDEEARQIMLRLIATRCDQGGIVIISSHEDREKFPFGSELNLQDFSGKGE